MEDHFNGFVVELPVPDPLDEVHLVQVVHDLQPLDVLELHHIGQIVHHQDVIPALFIQTLDDIAANKTGTSGYNDHNLPSLTSSAIFRITPVVEYPSLKGRISTRPAYSRPATSSGL